MSGDSHEKAANKWKSVRRTIHGAAPNGKTAKLNRNRNPYVERFTELLPNCMGKQRAGWRVRGSCGQAWHVSAYTVLAHTFGIHNVKKHTQSDTAELASDNKL